MPQSIGLSQTLQSNFSNPNKVRLLKLARLMSGSSIPCFGVFDLDEDMIYRVLNVCRKNYISTNCMKDFSDPQQRTPRHGKNSRFSSPSPKQTGAKNCKKDLKRHSCMMFCRFEGAPHKSQIPGLLERSS